MGPRHCLYHNLIADKGDANIYCNSNKQAKKVEKGENPDMGPSPNSTLFLRNTRDKTIPGLATSLIHSGRNQGRKTLLCADTLVLPRKPQPRAPQISAVTAAGIWQSRTRQ